MSNIISIAAVKINETAFNDISELIDKNKWLKQHIDPLMELWNICDLREQQELIKDLFDRFIFIEVNELASLSKKIVEKVGEWGFNPPNTFIAAIADADKSEVDGSIAGLQLMKNKFDSTKGWKGSYFYSSITKAAHEVKNNDNLVLFDDFIGSGKTLVRKLVYLKKTLADRKIKLKELKVVAFAGMEFGVKRVESESEVEVFCPILLKKGITDYETGSSIEIKKQLMRNLEEKLAKKFYQLKLSDHSLGYKGSETLFQINGQNCPNNLFPIFWWPKLRDNEPRKTLFQRLR